MRTRKLNCSFLGMLACHAMAASTVFGQGAQPWNVDSGNWNTPGNWLLAVVPDAGFGDTAAITNGGTAILNSAAAFPVGGVAVGPGTLEFASVGSLNVVDASSTDAAATGFFSISGAGRLILAANANVMAEGNVNLNGNTTVTGSSASLATQGNLSFGLSSVYNANISNATTHSVFTADGSATLGGTLNVAFSGAAAPTLGSVWTLVDAASIDGNFGTIRATGIPLGAGQTLAVNKSAGGKGTLARLTVEQRLVLEVNRQTGATTLKNPGTAPIAFEGYSVQSIVGSLNPANGAWNSLQDQGVASWFETPSSSTGLAELQSSVGGNLAVAASGQRALGSAFSPLLPFGSATPEDLVFNYRDAAKGVLKGVVQYVGNVRANNLVLTIDPVTGNAQVRNASPGITVDLQGYTITSAAGSLLASFESSLPNAQWAETAGSANGVGELNFTSGVTTLAPGGTFNLTGVFTPAGAQDLVFQFRREVPSEGDFNDDGLVNSADFSGSAQSFSSRFGADLDGGDFLAWQRGFGGTAASGGQVSTGIVNYDGSFAATPNLSAVPEPTATMLIAIAVLAVSSASRDARRRGCTG